MELVNGASKNGKSQPIKTADEIDILNIVKTLWKYRKTLFITLGICIVIGIFVAFSTPNVYTVSSVFVPQVSNKSNSSLSNLASLAGIDFGMAQNVELSPLIYPKIVNSIPFKLALINTPLHFSKLKKPVSLYDYYTKYDKPSVLSTVKKYTIRLPFTIISVFLKKQKDEIIASNTNKSEMIKLTITQAKIIKSLGSMIMLNIEKKEGYLTLLVSMPEPLAAAELAKRAQELLQQEIINFKIEKSQADLDFIQERYNIAKTEAERFQINVAVNTDRFKNLTSTVPQVSNARVQSKYVIANNVYQDLAKQLEQAKIQVKRDTPVFTIIEPVSIPTEKSGPNRPKILIIWIFMGCIMGSGIIYLNIWIKKVKAKWHLES